MVEPRQIRSEVDGRAELRLAAMVAEHERRKWSVVAHVVDLLATLGEPAPPAGSDDVAERRP